jgi:hypothetical protein
MEKIDYAYVTICIAREYIDRRNYLISGVVEGMWGHISRDVNRM